MNKYLVIIDMQNDFISGSLGTPEARLVEQRIADEIDFSAYTRIFFTRDTHFGNYLETAEGKILPIKHCLYDTHGWEISDKIMQKVDESSIIYHRFDKASFGYTGWRHNVWMIEPEDEVDIVGVCTDICVVSNALIIKSLIPESSIKVLAQYCAGTTPEMHQAALEVMQSCQIKIIK